MPDSTIPIAASNNNIIKYDNRGKRRRDLITTGKESAIK